MFRAQVTAHDRDHTLGELECSGDGCAVRVTALHETDDGLSVTVTADGVRLAEPGPVGSRVRRLTWADVRRLVRTGEVAPACRWGVVIDGNLDDVLPDLQHACDRAASARLDGRDVRIIRVPDTTTTA